jgi:uncharacterized membrane protein YfcA
MEYIIYFGITLVVSTIFSIGGVGSSVALIPILSFFGIHFDLAKAVGLFSNSISTFSASAMNIKRKLFDTKEVIPFVALSIIFAPIGTKIAVGIDTYYIKLFFAFFILFSATMMIRGKIKPKMRSKGSKKIVLMISGVIVGLLSGILGIGGGAFIVPLLIFLGYEAKKVAVMVSFIIPFATTSAFFMYSYLIEIDWYLLLSVAIGSILGGLLGNHIMLFKISAEQTKKIIAILLYIISLKMLSDLLI